MFQDFLFSFFSNYFQSSVNLKIVDDCSGNIASRSIRNDFIFTRSLVPSATHYLFIVLKLSKLLLIFELSKNEIVQIPPHITGLFVLEQVQCHEFVLGERTHELLDEFAAVLADLRLHDLVEEVCGGVDDDGEHRAVDDADAAQFNARVDEISDGTLLDLGSV